MFKPKKAFTLIELLVVIAIIGILATISVLALSNARAKSRDAKRAGDMKQIQTALELFFNDNNRYPTAEEWNTGKIYSTSTGSTSTYMQVIPTAPTPADGTCSSGQNTVSYTPTSDGSSYSISFCLGNTTGTLTPGPKCLTPAGILDVDCGQSPTSGIFTDARDGQQYPWTTIGNQVWMTKNLAYLPSVSPGSDGDGTNPYYYVFNYQGTDVATAKSQTNFTTYGVLYNQPAAAISCPAGWHLPSDADFYALELVYFDPSYYLPDENFCNADHSNGNCDPAGESLRTGAFLGLLGGRRSNSGSFYHLEGYGNYRTSSSAGSQYYVRTLGVNDISIYRNTEDGDNGISVRCLRD